MCVEILKNPESFLDHLYNWEMISWGLVLGFLMLRLITLGSKINKKYRNLSVLLTEQINLYLQVGFVMRCVLLIYFRTMGLAEEKSYAVWSCFAASNG